MGPFPRWPRSVLTERVCTLRAGLAPPRAADAGGQGRELRLQVGELLAKPPHRGALLPGSLLLGEGRGSSSTDIDCIGVSLTAFPNLKIFRCDGGSSWSP